MLAFSICQTRSSYILQLKLLNLMPLQLSKTGLTPTIASTIIFYEFSIRSCCEIARILIFLQFRINNVLRQGPRKTKQSWQLSMYTFYRLLIMTNDPFQHLFINKFPGLDSSIVSSSTLGVMKILAPFIQVQSLGIASESSAIDF